MPELPEVEVVRRNLNEMIPKNEKIKDWFFYRSDLRFKIPKSKLLSLVNRPIVQIDRRAKYILFDFGDQILISHLGMTGSWRQEKSGYVKRKHDHLAFEISKNRVFVYEDPRRFGFVEVVQKNNLARRFKDLGVEPLDSLTDFNKLTQFFKKLHSPIKVALLNQKYVVGIGNIYACEVLFRAKVNPFKACSKLGLNDYRKIWREAVALLNDAIAQGGSSIENYRNGYGEAGRFQKSFFVYGREKLECCNCHTIIKRKVQSGRSTFWCSSCQK